MLTVLLESDEDLAFADFDEDEFFEMGAALDVDSINLVESFGNEVSIDAAAESFGEVCDRAADHDWRVHLEFMPISGVPDLETAWAIVSEADRPNGGLLFDTWHYFRGEPDHNLLSSIPGDRIFRVQLADAAAEVSGSLYNDLLHYQRLPGEGDFDLPTVIGILDNIGALTRSVSSCFPIGSTTSTLDAIRELLAKLPLGTLAVIYAIGVIVQIVFFMIPVDIPFYLESVTPVGETLTGLAIAAATLTGAIVASRYQQIKARLGVVGVLAVMFGFMGIGLFVVSLGRTYAVIVAGTAITGLGVGLQQPNLTSWIGNAVPDDARGRALGGLTSSFFVGQFLSPVITEPTSEIVGGLGPTFSIGGIVFLVLAVVAIAVQFGIRPRIAGAREEQT